MGIAALHLSSPYPLCCLDSRCGFKSTLVVLHKNLLDLICPVEQMRESSSSEVRALNFPLLRILRGLAARWCSQQPADELTMKSFLKPKAALTEVGWHLRPSCTRSPGVDTVDTHSAGLGRCPVFCLLVGIHF